MTRGPDILFTAEYIKNVLYFTTVRQGKILKDTFDTHYFCIDNELIYENYYSDFGPLNLGCVYKYCKILNEKLKLYLNKRTIVHYTSTDPKKKANSAFLLGCYGVLYLSLPPREALKPLLLHGQSYKPFQDATQGESTFTITLIDCLQAVKKARDLGFFNFNDFNYEEYDRLDKIQGGDLNWIVPGKFLAFIGPVDYSVSLYHPPEMYIDYFLENNVNIVIRLNKRLYDGNIFNNVSIIHYDLFFPDGSCPPRHILFKFLQISEESEGGIAVHCKAGLGRTGSLIGSYLIKHYRMTHREAIGWMRICRPGSVIGHQQGWLEQIEQWLIKQGNLYRKRMYQDTDKFPVHDFGVYSIAEKTMKQRPIIFHKPPSPPPPINRQTRSDLTAPARPQASKIRDGNIENEDEEIFLTSCDLTVKPTMPMTQLKGCIIKNNTISEEYDEHDSSLCEQKTSFWKKYLCCKPCFKSIHDSAWMLAVRCARVAPNKCNKLCSFLDMAAFNTKTEKEQPDWRVRSPILSTQKSINKGDLYNTGTHVSRCGSGAGEPRPTRCASRGSSVRAGTQRSNLKLNASKTKNIESYHPLTTFRTSEVPVMKSVNDARNFLLRSSIFNKEREKQLNCSLTVTPHYCARTPNYLGTSPGNMAHIAPSSFSSASRGPTQPQNRRRLGRSPSPPQIRMSTDQTCTTNAPLQAETVLVRDASKAALKKALSRLKLSVPRDGSIGAASVGAASLGARRDAPAPKRAPSVRSDERPLATQGDMLNSIKFQRRLRDTLHSDKVGGMFRDKIGNATFKDKPSVNPMNSRSSSKSRATGVSHDFGVSREKPSTASKGFFSPIRPSSPKGRRTQNNNHTMSFY